MILADYMQTNGLGDGAMAEKIGRSRASVSRWRRGLERPSSEVILLIVEATGGMVTANDLLGIEQQEAAE